MSNKILIEKIKWINVKFLINTKERSNGGIKE